jgi:hypothetical protein
MMAIPAFAHHLTNVTVWVVCDKFEGQVIVEVTGTILDGTDNRYIWLDLYDSADLKNPLNGEEVSILVPENHSGKDVPFDSKLVAFPALAHSPSSLTVQITKVTSDAAGKVPADLVIKGAQLPNGEVDYSADHQPVTSVGDVGKCQTPATPPPASAAPPVSASPAATAATLASTGGLDFRFSLVGLVVLIAGAALFVVSAARGRTAGK